MPFSGAVGQLQGRTMKRCFPSFLCCSLRSKRFHWFFRPESRHFSRFGGAKIGASATLMEGASPPPSRTFWCSPQFSRVQKQKNASNLRKSLRRRLLRRLSVVYFHLRIVISFSESGQHFLFRCIAQKFGSTVKSNSLQCQVSTYV